MLKMKERWCKHILSLKLWHAV